MFKKFVVFNVSTGHFLDAGREMSKRRALKTMARCAKRAPFCQYEIIPA